MIQQRTIRMGEIGVLRDQGKFRMTLGSCIAVFLYDHESRIAGAAHIVLPTSQPSMRSTNDEPSNLKERGNAPTGANPTPARYADLAIDHLIAAMENEGAQSRRMIADFAGGGTMFGPGARSDSQASPIPLMEIGKANIEAVHQALAEREIMIRHVETGGQQPRQVVFDVETGTWTIREIATARPNGGPNR